MQWLYIARGIKNVEHHYLWFSHTCTNTARCFSLLVTFPHLLSRRLPNGAEYLFLARDEADVAAWVQAINSVIQGGGSGATSSSVSSGALSSPPLSQIGSPTHSGNFYIGSNLHTHTRIVVNWGARDAWSSAP